MKNFSNILKLWKQMLQLAEIETDKGKLIIESELAEGIEVFVETEEGYAPAADGEYVYEDMLIVVSDGKISELRKNSGEDEPAEETPEEQEQPSEEENAEEEEPKAEEAEEEPESDERDAKIAEQEAKITELEAIIAERDARIAELEAELAQKQEELEMSADEPAKDKVKNNEKLGALKYFN